MEINSSEEKYVICSLCKKHIAIGPYIFVDIFEKEWWWDRDSKPYWKNRDSGMIYCDECFNKVYWEPQFCGQEA